MTELTATDPPPDGGGLWRVALARWLKPPARALPGPKAQREEQKEQRTP